MPEPGTFTIRWGLKVHVSTMDRVSALLREKTRSDDVLYVVPSVDGHDKSSHVFVAYSYLHIYVQRCITANDPADTVPEWFGKLQKEILKFDGDEEEGLVGLFVVYSEQDRLIPPELKERYQLSIKFRPCEYEEAQSTRKEPLLLEFSIQT